MRACGCLYALSQAIDTAPFPLDDDVIVTTKRLARFLIKYSRFMPSGVRVLDDEPSSTHPKVGATALLLLALSYPTLKATFPGFESEFRASIHLCQKRDGRFVTHFGTEEERREQLEFYPGQVLLGLALEVEAGSQDAIRRCAAAFPHYREHFNNAPTTAFVGWQLDAWARLAVRVGREDYADFAFQQADWLAARQITHDTVPDHIGGFAKADGRPNYSTIVYIEALIRALRLAVTRGDSDRQERYRIAVRRGLTFVRRLQLRHIPSAFFANTRKSVGGVSLSLDNLNVRCDVVQHFLTLGLATYANYELIYP